MEVKKKVSRGDLLEALRDPEFGTIDLNEKNIRAFVASIPDDVFEREYTETVPDPTPATEGSYWSRELLPTLTPLKLSQLRPLPLTKGKAITFRHLDNIRENPR